MKRTLTFLILWLTVVALQAQYPTLICSGTVNDLSNGTPIPNHEVIIHNDSLQGTTGYFYHTVYTNQNGYYFDSIPLNNLNMTGTVHIGTIDCQNYLNVYTAAYGPALFNIQHNFSICNTNSTCSADFYAYPDSSLTNTFIFDPYGAGDITTWVWEFGDGTSTTITFPASPIATHTYSLPDLYEVCLSVFGNDSSCYDRKCSSVYVGNGGNCIANFSYSDSTNAGNTIQFIDLSTSSVGPIASWYWDFGDPASGVNNYSTAQNPIHAFSAQGPFNVCLTIQGSDSSCYDMTCKTIYIGSGGGCQANFDYTIDSISVPTGTPVHFRDLSTGNPTQWSWSFGDGTGSDEQNPVHYFAATGTYNVCLTIHGDSCQDSYCKTVTIGNTPNCSTYFEYSATYLDVSFEGFIIHNNSLSGGGVYTWSFGDGSSGLGQSVTHVYPATGSYTVILTASDSSGCTSTYQETITLYDSVNTHQIYGQVLAGNFPVTSALVMIFSVDSTANPGTYSPYIAVAPADSMGIYYFTMVPDGDYYILAIPILPEGYLPTYYGDVLNWESATVVHPGEDPIYSYDIHLIDANTYLTGNGTINGQINVSGLKSDMLDKVTMILMNDQLQGIGFYRLNNTGDFTFPELSFGTYYLKAEIPGVTSDLVKVEINSETPVASVTMTFNGNRILGVEKSPAIITAGSVYPNPATDIVNITLQIHQSTQVQIDLFNLAGQNLISLQRSVETGMNLIPVRIDKLTKGLYTIRIQSSDGTAIIHKLIK